MSPSDIPWWAWPLIILAFWITQMTVDTDKETTGAWVLRGTLVLGMFLSTLAAIVLFVRWVWRG